MVAVAVVVATSAHDDVVDERNVDGLAGVFHSLGELVVGSAGRWGVAGVIMSENDAIGQLLNSSFQYYFHVAHGGRSAPCTHSVVWGVKRKGYFGGDGNVG